MFPNMSGRGRNKDVRTGHAVAFLLRCQGAKVPEALRATKFTLEESTDTMKQMAVRRAYTKATGGKPKSPFPVSVDAVTNTSSISPLTQPTATSITLKSPQEMTPARDGDSIVPKPKQRQIQKTSSGMQNIYLMPGEESHGKFGTGGRRAMVAEVVLNNPLFIPSDNDSN